MKRIIILTVLALGAMAVNAQNQNFESKYHTLETKRQEMFEIISKMDSCLIKLEKISDSIKENVALYRIDTLKKIESRVEVSILWKKFAILKDDYIQYMKEYNNLTFWIKEERVWLISRERVIKTLPLSDQSEWLNYKNTLDILFLSWEQSFNNKIEKDFNKFNYFFTQSIEGIQALK